MNSPNPTMHTSPNPSLIARIDRTGYLLLAARLVLGIVFVYMGYRKLEDPMFFLKQVKLYGVLPLDPPYWLNLTAIALPWLEIAAGVCLILGVLIRGSAIVLAAMLLTFIPALYARAMDISHSKNIPICAVKFDCGCGTGERIICHKIAENTGLTVLALISLFSRSRRFCLSSMLRPRGAPAPLQNEESPPTRHAPRTASSTE